MTAPYRDGRAMSGARRKIVVVVTVLAVLAAACRRSPSTRDAQETARLIADHAASPEQAQRWREAAARGRGRGLERLPVLSRPVDAPQRSAAPPQAPPVQPPSQSIVIPPPVRSALRVLKPPAPDLPQYAGSARVVGVANEEIELAIQPGANRGAPPNLVFLARVDRAPLLLRANEDVQLDYRGRVADDPFEFQYVVAVKTREGDGIMSAAKGSRQRVTIAVPLFQLVATQLPNTPPGEVDVRVVGSHSAVRPGQILEVGPPADALCVGLLSSRAYEGSDAGRLEGSAYSIDLIAWPKRSRTCS